MRRRVAATTTEWMAPFGGGGRGSCGAGRRDDGIGVRDCSSGGGSDGSGGGGRGSGAKMLLQLMQIALAPSVKGHNLLMARWFIFIVRLLFSSERENEKIGFNS